jgi:hypothetical protein
LILSIAIAKASEPARRGHALFKGYETAIRAADRSHAVNRAPWIVLGFGACSNADDTDANSQHEQQEPHSRLLGGPSVGPHSLGEALALKHKLFLLCLR